jgi:hypothetical protein
MGAVNRQRDRPGLSAHFRERPDSSAVSCPPRGTLGGTGFRAGCQNIFQNFRPTCGDDAILSDLVRSPEDHPIPSFVKGVARGTFARMT